MPRSSRAAFRVLATAMGLAVASATLPALTPGAATRADAAAGTGAGDWTVYHHDGSRSGVGAAAPSAVPPRAAWSTPLDGAVYAEPLVSGGVVVAVTENDTVYGLDLNSGAVRWRDHLGSPVPLSSLPCGDIDPLGITSTPAIDAGGNRLFVVAEEQGAAGVQHELVSLDPGTGAIQYRRPVDPPGMDPRVQQQRAALALSSGSVEVAFGGLYGDCGEYHGWVVSAAEDGSGPLHTFRTSGGEGGIWASGGPAVDSAGNVFVATGNGSSSSSYDQGNSVIKLSPTGAVLDYFAPRNFGSNSAADLDLGSSAPILLDGGLLFIAGKDGVGYLVDANHLGGVGGEKFSASVCPSFGAQAYSPPMLYVQCAGAGIAALRVDPSAATFTVVWRSPVKGAGPPVVGAGAVWAENLGNGTLAALDPSTGGLLASVATGPPAHFTTPTVLPGTVLVAAGGKVAAFTASGGGVAAPPTTQGYWLAEGNGTVLPFGTAPPLGSVAAPVIGMAATPDRKGYWLVGPDGGVFSFGDAVFQGSTGGMRLAQPVVGMAATPSGHGYWLVASDGGVFSFGDAVFQGSTGGMRLAQPVVGMAATPSGHGYWLVASDGGVFSFGDARFQGSTGAIHLNAPIVGMAAAAGAPGYWLVASDGGVFSFGAPVLGSAGAAPLAAPVVAMATHSTGRGYWLVAADGGVFNFGDAEFAGAGAGAVSSTVVGMGSAA